MPYQIKLEQPPLGYCASNARPGEMVKVQTFEYVSSDDGEHFIAILEAFPSMLLQNLPPDARVPPSQVDHLLAIIRRDGCATVYLNELSFIARVRVARSLAAGSPVFKDDIVDIERLEIGDIQIPADCGMLFLMSVGWRKGLIYDFGPLSPEGAPRSFDPLTVFGQMKAHLLFQDRFRITEEVWEKLFQSSWYPFIALGSDLIKTMVSHAADGWDLQEFADKARQRILQSLDNWMDMWRRHPVFSAHIHLIGTAVEHFKKGEWASCIALAYPRIEGLLRSYYRSSSKSGKPTDAKLAKTATAHASETSVVIPHRFERYLRVVYFRHYDPSNGFSADLWRHSVEHGEASHAVFDMKSAVITVLILHHLTFAFKTQQNQRPDSRQAKASE